MTGQRKRRVPIRKHVDAFRCGEFLIHITSRAATLSGGRDGKVAWGSQAKIRDVLTPLVCFEQTTLVGNQRRARALPDPIDSASS